MLIGDNQLFSDPSIVVQEMGEERVQCITQNVVLMVFISIVVHLSDRWFIEENEVAILIDIDEGVEEDFREGVFP